MLSRLALQLWNVRLRAVVALALITAIAIQSCTTRDPNSEFKKMTSALADAASEGEIDRVIELIAAGAPVNPVFDRKKAELDRREMHREIIRIARSNGLDAESLQAFKAELDAMPDDAGPLSYEIPLHAAVEAGCAECVRVLLAAGADVRYVDSDRRIALAFAKSLEIAEQLLAAGSDPLATDNRGYDVLDCVLGVDLDGHDELDETDDRLKISRLLIARGVALERTRDDWTRLYTAAFRRNPRAIDTLLQLGHPVTPDEGRTALHALAWHYGYGDERDVAIAAMFQSLIGAGCDVSAVDSDGNTAIHYAVAADGGNLLAARVLLDAGADVNARNNDGETPLVHLYHHGFDYEQLVPLLLERGANPLLKDNRGINAIDAARNMAAGGEPPWRSPEYREKAIWKGPAEAGSSEWRMIRLMEEAAKKFSK